MPNLLNQLSFESISAWIIRVLALLFSLSVHELAHGWTAYRLGDPTAREAGRLTMNPLSHLDRFGAAMILLGAPIAWARPVPVNPARFRRGVTVKGGLVRVAAAGPLSNLVIAAAAYLIFGVMQLTLLTRMGTALSPVYLLAQLMLTLFYINLNLAVFNLLPVPPLDGFKVFGALLPSRAYHGLMRYEQYIGVVFLLLIVFRPGWLSGVLTVVRYPLQWLITTPLNLIFNLFV